MTLRCLPSLSRISLFLLLSGVLAAADASGRWTGTMKMNGQDGPDHPGTAVLVLKQEGTVLTGTAGPNENDQKTIRDGKAENGVLSFAVEPHEGVVMKFVLKQSGDEISGDIQGELDGKAMTATISLTREK